MAAWLTKMLKMAVISTEGRDLEPLKLAWDEISPYGRNDILADIVNPGWRLAA
ncbi:hypothetical protein HYY75_03760 [bacterium]|nr:hypothetical protein [bacterium]